MNDYQVSDAMIDRLNRLEVELHRVESSLKAANRRLRLAWAAVFGTIFASLVLASSPTAQAQFGVTLASLNARLLAVENKTAPMTYDSGNKLLTISGADVMIVDGTGSTNSTSGLGNLQIGYNALRGSGDDRTGSHNLILGDANNYSGFGGIVSGYSNTSTSNYNGIIGGSSNTTSAAYAATLGGASNTASGQCSTVSGGSVNHASNSYSGISGGSNNHANGQYSSVTGGAGNNANSAYSSVNGGSQNMTTNGAYATVSGGISNTASGQNSTVSGGGGRSATTYPQWVGGGYSQPN